jgi:hypothetical protein
MTTGEHVNVPDIVGELCPVETCCYYSGLHECRTIIATAYPGYEAEFTSVVKHTDRVSVANPARNRVGRVARNRWRVRNESLGTYTFEQPTHFERRRVRIGMFVRSV